MAPTPFSESNFGENPFTTLIPIQHKNNTTSASHLHRNLVNNSTRTNIQNLLKQSILQAKRDFEDYAETQRNVLSNNFKNQLNGLRGGSPLIKPFNDFHIIKKGPFFEDPFFNECRQQFEESVQNIVNKFGLKNSEISESSNDWLNNGIGLNNNFLNDAFKSYRNLRDNQLQEENQAASLVHEDHQHKIVIDVKDFMGGDIKVTSFKNTIRIEGHQENSSQSPQNINSSKRNFSKEFTLPGTVNMGAVKSTMSSDGILTITVPRSQREATTRLSFPTESRVTQSLPSQTTNSSSQDINSPSHITQLPSHMSQTSSRKSHIPPHLESHVTIEELPCNGHSDANSGTSQNYVTYPEEVNGVTCQSYSRKPHGGYWKR